MAWHCGADKCATHSSPDHQCVGWRLAKISGSVGQGGGNSPPDVRVMQGALNRFPPDCGGPNPKLSTDGILTSSLVEAIKAFQRMFFGTPTPDGRIDLAGRT